jgi:hypothetical protein
MTSATRRLRNTVVILALGVVVTTSTRAASWTVSEVGSGVLGKYSSLQIDQYANAHVSYFDEAQGLLMYGFWDRNLGKWFNTPLDRSSGFCSMVLDTDQRPHISYPDGSGTLREIYWDGSTWTKRTIEIRARVINYYTSITLDAKNNPTISFYEELGQDENRLRLRIVTWNGKFWAVKTVDDDHGSGKFNSIATDSHGYQQIAYGNVEYKNASLRYARWNGKSWDVEVLEGAGKPGTSMWSVAMVLDKADVPHIAYTDAINGLVKYATKRNGAWELQIVDQLSNVAYPDRNGIALDEQGKPYISYFDGGAGLLKVAHVVNDKWVTEVVDRYSGFTSSLQIRQGRIWLTYSDANGRLKFARRGIEPVVERAGSDRRP